LSFKIKEELGLLEGIATCQEHSCPLITVEQDGEDYYLCLFEAVDRLIGRQRITRVQVADGFLCALQFENGYRLIPLCPCCGKPTLRASSVLRNKMLTGMAWDAVDSGEDYPALVLYFATTPEATEAEAVPVHIESVRSIQKISG